MKMIQPDRNTSLIALRTFFHLIAAAFAIVVQSVFADTSTVPPGFEKVEGNGGSIVSFTSAAEVRVEQISTPSLFPVLPSSSGVFRFSELSFRFDSGGGFPGSDNATFQNIQIYLSTSPAEFPSGFSVDMDRNHLNDKILVFNSGTTIQGQIPIQGPADFDIRFPFTNPYDYDPRKGNLVMEIRKYGADAFSHSIDEQGFVSDSRLFVGLLDGSFNEALGDIALISQFTYSIVPEPTPGVLILTGVCLWAMLKFSFKTCGHLFAGRRKTLLVDSSGTGYLQTLSDYAITSILIPPAPNCSNPRPNSKPSPGAATAITETGSGNLFHAHGIEFLNCGLRR
jgi:hypothetical protein